ncbi:YdbH domain-containing protein [Hyphococcus sp. DH-69]|uniref:intermembrane phospholipid transport protein YdbH family protein n=1 Tax=Hyphococcus formosus TaxID=3143534 RepID=UPI00398B7E11
MRMIRLFGIVLLALVVLSGALYLVRLPIASWGVREAMSRAGLENPQATVTALTLNQVRIENLSVGPNGGEGLRLNRIESAYNWRELLTERMVERVAIGPGLVRLKIDDEGNIVLPGFRAGSGGNERDMPALPFQKLSLADVEVLVDAPDGGATGSISADYDFRSGGSATLDISSEQLKFAGYSFARSNTRFDLNLSDNGDISISGTFNSDLEFQGALASDIAIGFEAAGRSWREAVSGNYASLMGQGKIQTSAPNIDVQNAALFETLRTSTMEALLGGVVTGGAAEGAFDIALSNSVVEVSFSEPTHRLSLVTNKGTELTLSPQGSVPFLVHSDQSDIASFQFEISGSGVNAEGAVDAEYIDGNWRVIAPINIAAYDSPALALSGSLIDIEFQSTGADIRADLALKSGLKKLNIGRLTIDDTPFTGFFEIAANIDTQSAVIINKDECLAFARTHALLAEQDMEVHLNGVELCNKGGSLARLNWTDRISSTLNGELSAQDAKFRIGQTKAEGKPPIIQFDADYHIIEDVTRIIGDVAKGDMTLNNALDMSAVDGGFEFTLNETDMTIDAIVDRLLIEQHGDAPLVSPVIANATANIRGTNAKFDYVLSTPVGERLGTGTGTQDMQKASGQTVFSFEGLSFTPEGVQPNKLSPVLKGFVDAANGEMGGEMVFEWGPNGVTSAANFGFDNISFAGPTRAVTRTSGFNGAVALTNLMPVQTDGQQTVTVDVVDMDALKLVDGTITFDVPGNDTIIIPQAEFPWFGGVIGVYDAEASLTGEAKVPLRADNVDLQQIFEYVDVNGLSGEGVMNGVLPVVFEDGKARIEDGYFKSAGPGAIRYQGAAAEQAAAAGGNAKIAFDILRDLRYNSMEVRVNGALDGRLDFQMFFEGTGEVNMENAKGRVPVKYTISLDAALLELLQQANLSRSFQLQIERGLQNVE